jgi:anthranilate phosphoribosyltransferase
MTTLAHPFAAYLRTIGRGPTLSKPLEQGDAEQAMAMILEGAVEPVQLGAFLLVLRYRTETAAELAGFVRAARHRLAVPATAGADLDWPSYADRHKQLPYFVLAARALADQGVRILMHGIAGEGDATTPKVLAALGMPITADAGVAAHELDRSGFAYLALEGLLPELARLFELRPLLGLRSPVNSLARELNPFVAPAQLQGVFHPNYAPLHADTANLLNQPAAAVFKGGGGEAQRNPEKPCRTLVCRDGVIAEEVWPALTADDAYPWRKEPLDPARVAALWRGEWSAPGPEAAVVGTIAVALSLLGRADSIDDAHRRARDMWDGRVKSLLAA